MSDIIGKGPDWEESLMFEVESLFEMDSIAREKVENAIAECCDPDLPSKTYADLYVMAGLEMCRVSGQPVESENYTDEDGNPDGGWVDAPGLQIRWQRGPVDFDDATPWNGCFLVTVLEAARRQLEFYQGGKFKCHDNEEALLHVESAIRTLNRRQVDRFKNGIRGKHK